MLGLSVEFAGLRLRNPLMNASGILGLTSLSLKRIAESGAGAVVTKSVGLVAREGFPNPTVVEVDYGLINAMGLPNPSIFEYGKELSEFSGKIKVPIILSIYVFSADELAEISRTINRLKVEAVELNVSCPHIEEVGVQIGQNTTVLAEVVSKAKSQIDKPLIVKLSPNVTDVASMAKVAEQAGADAITAINTVKAMAIDVETGRPILAGKFGGLSGPAIKPIALRCVYEIFDTVKIPIIGCGGISCWEDAVEFFMAGASAVQIGTAILYGDLKIFTSIIEGLRRYMKKKKIKSIQQIVGVSHKF
jgi:dihydroorotate dehydrogenase (NAD+) catalytic subunit